MEKNLDNGRASRKFKPSERGERERERERERESVRGRGQPAVRGINQEEELEVGIHPSSGAMPSDIAQQ